MRLIAWVAAACAAAALWNVAFASDAATPDTVHSPSARDAVFPPWQHGANNDAINRGLDFTVPEADVLADFHGDLSNPKLVLYVGGNYFFAMAPLIKRFEEEHPSFRGHIFWETIPPGLLERQMEAGGTVTSGNMTWTIKPDAYFAGLAKVKTLIAKGSLVGPPVAYATNTLAIMVPVGNPAHIASLTDLGKPSVRLVLPNPEFEGIARQIKEALRKAGGEKLVHTVYTTKVQDGSALLTHIHHRQTPIFLMQGRGDAGITWQSEAIFQEQAGHPLAHVDIPPQQNATAIYAGAMVRGAAHPQAARQWLDFIHSDGAFTIFAQYGFKPYRDRGQ